MSCTDVDTIVRVHKHMCTYTSNHDLTSWFVSNTSVCMCVADHQWIHLVYPKHNCTSGMWTHSAHTYTHMY